MTANPYHVLTMVSVQMLSMIIIVLVILDSQVEHVKLVKYNLSALFNRTKFIS
jgi:hypothetical protein